MYVGPVASDSSSSSRVVTEDRVGPAAALCSNVVSCLGKVFCTLLDGTDALSEAAPVKRAKEFCVGLLDNPVNHAWWPALCRLGRREQMRVSASLFLLRKVLPSSPDPRQAEKHAKLISQPAAPPAEGYMSFIDSKIDDMFPVGWDRGYASRVFSTSPNPSACQEQNRRDGGARALLSTFGREWFEDQCLGECDRPSDYRCRFSVVRTSGKQRGVTVSPVYSHVLGPLHRTLFDHVSEQDWLLRGEARGRRFRRFVRKRGEVFVSGDYESATDNLSTEVAERILDRVLSRARHVPLSLKEYALRSLRPEVSYPGGHVVQLRRGQMMGSYLSFPLLCLQNYLAFAFLTGGSYPVKINGDDIVFRCPPSVFDVWAKGVGRLGLTLCKGKTMVDNRFFSLNSAFFEAQTGRAPRDLPVLRPSCLEERGAIPSSGSFRRFTRGWTGDARRLVGGLWLSSHRRSIDSTGRSVECLGIPADNAQLHTARLSVREAFFRGPRKSLRLPESPISLQGSVGCASTPEGWVKTTRFSGTSAQVSQWSREFGQACLDLVWTPDSLTPDRDTSLEAAWEEIKRTGFADAWFSWRRTVKRAARLLGGHPLNSILRPPDLRPCRTAEWVPESFVVQDDSSRRGLGWLP